MNEEFKKLYTKYVQYYDGFQEVLKPKNEEKYHIKYLPLVINMYKKAKQIKEGRLVFDRNICVEILRVLELSDQALFMSLSNPEQYNKDYSDQEIEENEVLNKIKNMSVQEIDNEINSFLFCLAFKKYAHPLVRLSSYLATYRKGKDDIMTKVLTLFENVSCNDINTYDADIIKEIFNDNIKEFLVDNLRDISNNIIRKSFEEFWEKLSDFAANTIILSPDDNDKTNKLSTMLLSLAIYYYKYSFYVDWLTEKEKTIIKPYFDGLTNSLRESYPDNKSSVLVEILYNLMDSDIANELFRDIHNYPELSWVHVDLPDRTMTTSEWSVPINFFSRPTYVDSKEFVGSVLPMYEDSAFIKSVVDELARNNNIDQTPLAKQWTLFLLTGKEKPISVKPSDCIWKGEVNALLYVCKYLYGGPGSDVKDGTYKKAIELFGATTKIIESKLPAYAERPKNKILVSLFKEHKKKKKY